MYVHKTETREGKGGEEEGREEMAEEKREKVQERGRMTAGGDKEGKK